MDPKTPIGWEHLEAVRGEPRLRMIFDAHREDVADTDSIREAVDHLKEIAREDDEIGTPIQGVAYVFAYLLETEADERFDDDRGGIPTGLADRRPTSATLERLFWDEEDVPWWIAVRYGVHYSLVVFWLWEDDVPLMRRNLPDSQFERLDLEEET